MATVLYPDSRSTAKTNPCFKDCSSSPISIACHDVFNGITSGGKNTYGNNATNKQHGQYYSKVQTSLSKTRAQLKLFGKGNDQNNTAIMEWQDRLANHTKYSPTGCQNVLDRVSGTASLCNQDASASAPCLACSRIWFSSKLKAAGLSVPSAAVLQPLWRYRWGPQQCALLA